MHNLEKSIAEWRKTSSTASHVGEEALDELESHLRETVDELVRSGLTEAEAFERAVKQLGGTPAIASEFQKLEQTAWWPVKVVIGLGAAAALTFAILSIVAFIFDTRPSRFLLATHVFTVGLGYTTTFLIGALGICFVGQRCFSDLSPARLRSVTRVTFILGCMAAALTAVGVILAMIWAKTEWGRYWAWDIKETGAFCVVTWQLCFLIAHRFTRTAARRILVMSILGNIVVGLGWFGANLFSSGLHNYQTWSYSLLLLVTVIFNFAFFLIGLAPAGWLPLRKAS